MYCTRLFHFLEKKNVTVQCTRTEKYSTYFLTKKRISLVFDTDCVQYSCLGYTHVAIVFGCHQHAYDTRHLFVSNRHVLYDSIKVIYSSASLRRYSCHRIALALHMRMLPTVERQTIATVAYCRDSPKTQSMLVFRHAQRSSQSHCNHTQIAIQAPTVLLAILAFKSDKFSSLAEIPQCRLLKFTRCKIVLSSPSVALLIRRNPALK